jgi:hypothetical protein
MKRQFLFSILGLLPLLACSDRANPEGIGDTEFESDDPSNSAAARGGGRASSSSGGSADAASSAPTTAEAPSANAGAAAARAVEEADIVKVEGDRLYALSQFGGLSIIDIANPAAMRIVGKLRLEAKPFEMYVRGDRVYVMLNDYGHYDESIGPYGGWVTSSEMIAIDVSNPRVPRKFANYDVPGQIADSRLVGDVAYVVTYENGSCWRCESGKPSTTVTSFSIANQGIGRVDQIAFKAPNNSYSYWQRSVSATKDRMYIAGPVWDWQPGRTEDSQRSVVQVIDIQDPGGRLRKGADVPVAGQIQSRWQMDEFNGVLRVVSQAGNGWGGASFINPKVQTFTITNSDTITPLGSTDLVLKKRESLRSVRFDGIRAYAITAEVKDPLFTIDLSNPAEPKALGELEMPGWVYHMEPRGDRLVGLGFDQENGRTLNVSLFDVSDLAHPKMIKRVNFGNGWAQLGEDQDRIHKSFQVIDDAGLIAVPFQSYGRWDGNGCSEAQSGIQLIDYSRDDLTLRGIAPQKGQPRRAIVRGSSLLGMTDRAVSSFSLTDRDKPVAQGEVQLSNPAYKIAKNTTHIVQITNEWWSGNPQLSVTPIAGADTADAVGSISLAEIYPAAQGSCGYRYGGFYDLRLFVEGNTAYVIVPQSYYYGYGSGRSEGPKLIAAAVDISNPAAPKILGKGIFDLPNASGGNYSYSYIEGGYNYYSGNYSSLRAGGEGSVLVGKRVAMIQSRVDYEANRNGNYVDPKVTRSLLSVDFSDPAKPRLAPALQLPESIGATPLLPSGTEVVTTRWTRAKTPGRVKFWMDRIDMTADPKFVGSVNVPGTVVQIDPAKARVTTVDYKRNYAPLANATRKTSEQPPPRQYEEHQRACRAALGLGGQVNYDYQYGDEANPSAPYYGPREGTITATCSSLTYKINALSLRNGGAVRNAILALPDGNVGAITATNERVFVTRNTVVEYEQALARPDSDGIYAPPKVNVLAKGGLSVYGGMDQNRVTFLGGLDGDSRYPLHAEGTRVVMYEGRGLSVYDTNVNVRLVGEARLRGYGYSTDILVDGNKAVCAVGDYGLQTVNLAP